MAVFREAQMRLAKPGLAKPFIHWRGLCQVARRKAKASQRKSEGQLLAEQEQRRVTAENEAKQVRSKLVEAEQALSLAKIALDDERRALVVARTEAEEAKTTAMQAREATTKLAAAEVRERNVQQQLNDALQDLERERQDAKRYAEQQKAAAEKDLAHHLAEQRKGFDAQMAQIKKEADERTKMAEERFQRALQEQAAEHAKAMEEVRRLRSASPPLVEPLVVPKPRQLSTLHPVWGRGPDLNTADRALAWEAYVRERNARPPHEAWPGAQQSAEAYRAARRVTSLTHPAVINRVAEKRVVATADHTNASSEYDGSPSAERLPSARSRDAALRSSASTSALQEGTTVERMSQPFVTEVHLHHRPAPPLITP